MIRQTTKHSFYSHSTVIKKIPINTLPTPPESSKPIIKLIFVKKLRNLSKTVLYLSYDGMTDPLGQSQVLPYLKGLSNAGYTIHLLSFEKSERFKKHRKHIASICKSSNIQWHPQDYASEGGLKNTLKQVRKMKKVAFYLHEKHQFDHTHCRSYISALIGLKLKRRKNVKFIFDMRGFWADERVDGEIWSLSNPIFERIYKFFKRKERQFFSEADYTISLTENGKNEIESWSIFQHKKPKIKVIPCCVDLELFNPSTISKELQIEARNQLNIHDDNFILGYVGSIGTWYMLSEMLDYFKILKETKKNARFLFVTGDSAEMIFSEAESRGVPKSDIIIQSSLHKDVPLYISIFNSSIFFIRPTYSKKASSPTKQGEIMAMGIPLICNAGVGDTDDIVLNSFAGDVVPNCTIDSYHQLFDYPATFDRTKTMEGAEKYFSLEEGVKRYLSVYKAIYA